MEPIGTPRSRAPVVISLESSMESASERALRSRGERKGKGEVPVMEVMMTVLSRLSAIPRGLPRVWNSRRNQGKSMYVRHIPVSSTMDLVAATEPLLSSLGPWPVFLRRLALARSVRLMGRRTCVKTRAARRPLRGQPWAKPSRCRKEL